MLLEDVPDRHFCLIEENLYFKTADECFIDISADTPDLYDIVDFEEGDDTVKVCSVSYEILEYGCRNNERETECSYNEVSGGDYFVYTDKNGVEKLYVYPDYQYESYRLSHPDLPIGGAFKDSAKVKLVRKLRFSILSTEE